MPSNPKADAKAEDLTKLKRDDLNEIAADAGVPNPDELPNKDAVVDAIEAPNPALAIVPEPDEGEVEWTVTAPVEVLGHKPGSTFKADLPANQKALLVESGHIKRTNSQEG